MTLCAALTADLIIDEGCGPMRAGHLVVYDDATGAKIIPGYTLKGHPTIGFGRCLDTNGLSYAEGRAMLNSDVEFCLTVCSNYLPFFDSLSEVRQRVISNMVYQLGLGGFMNFDALIKAIEISDWHGARDAMLNSVWARRMPARANKLAEWMINDSAGTTPCQTSPLNGHSNSPSPLV